MPESDKSENAVPVHLKASNLITELGPVHPAFFKHVIVCGPTIEIKAQAFLLNLFNNLLADFKWRRKNFGFGGDEYRDIFRRSKVRISKILWEFSWSSVKINVHSHIPCWSSSAVFHWKIKQPTLGSPGFFINRPNNAYFWGEGNEGSLHGDQGLAVNLVGIKHRSPLSLCINCVPDGRACYGSSEQNHENVRDFHVVSSLDALYLIGLLLEAIGVISVFCGLLSLLIGLSRGDWKSVACALLLADVDLDLSASCGFQGEEFTGGGALA